MTTVDERPVGGQHTFGGYIQSATNPDVVVHRGCGRVFTDKPPLDNEELSDWLPFCTKCFNTTCDRCGAQHYDPAITTGDPDQAHSLCGQCWNRVISL